MSNRSNYVVVITSLLSSAFRLLLVWPGVVLAIFGLIFFIATLCDNGAQKAASRMADTAQEYRAAPAGMVMVRLCPHADDHVWEVAPVPERDCKPHPKTFADVAKQERRAVLWIGGVLVVLGMLYELFYLLYRRRQMSLNAVYGSINARGERSVLFQYDKPVNDKEGRNE
ncbi:Uncharacterised protein [Serratia marcescens]|uniref:hypothetical protein n=1 Tax=Serratia marcescens TaxID=615 RepID=UPI0021796F2D|nr:hypothetical protein [Serratia marcescens]CAI1825243.1 Uncharacterised protein [Serratia marcescens]